MHVIYCFKDTSDGFIEYFFTNRPILTTTDHSEITTMMVIDGHLIAAYARFTTRCHMTGQVCWTLDTCELSDAITWNLGMPSSTNRPITMHINLGKHWSWYCFFGICNYEQKSSDIYLSIAWNNYQNTEYQEFVSIMMTNRHPFISQVWNAAMGNCSIWGKWNCVAHLDSTLETIDPPS